MLILLNHLEAFEELGIEITFYKLLVTHKLLVERNGCFYPLDYILAQCTAHGADRFFSCARH